MPFLKSILTAKSLADSIDELLFLNFSIILVPLLYNWVLLAFFIVGIGFDFNITIDQLVKFKSNILLSIFIFLSPSYVDS